MPRIGLSSKYQHSSLSCKCYMWLIYHWVVASNADPKRTGGYHTKAVGFYDSSRPLNVSVKM